MVHLHFVLTHHTFGIGLHLVGGCAPKPLLSHDLSIHISQSQVYILLIPINNPQIYTLLVSTGINHFNNTSLYTIFLVFPSLSLSSQITFMFLTEVTLDTPT